MNLLVLCTGNSARSIMLESIINSLSGGRMTAFSAGSKPVGNVHPLAIELLTQKGQSTNNLRSKSWDEFGQPDSPIMDVVITVCGNARDEICPVWRGSPIKGHWGIDDPAAIINTPAATKAAFEVAYSVLEARAKGWLQLDFENMDLEEKQRAVEQIGESMLVM